MFLGVTMLEICQQFETITQQCRNTSCVAFKKSRRIVKYNIALKRVSL